MAEKKNERKTITHKEAQRMAKKEPGKGQKINLIKPGVKEILDLDGNPMKKKMHKNVFLVAYIDGGVFMPLFSNLSNDGVRKTIPMPVNQVPEDKLPRIHFGCNKRFRVEGYDVFAVLMDDGTYYDALHNEFKDYLKLNNMSKPQFQMMWGSLVARYAQLMGEV